MASESAPATSAFMFQPAAGCGVQIAPAISLSRSCSSGVGSAWTRSACTEAVGPPCPEVRAGEAAQ
ncbi:hypothetical protein [Streptomyces bacillaris]|uniref:hypothetical protein n=1 Tax=Streptomyces bacillaris TaxID=68179 RepID=UPI00362CCDC1